MTHIARLSQPDADAFYVRGLLHLRDRSYEEAERLFTLALAQDPRHEGANRNLIRTLLATGRFADVIRQAGFALSIAPQAAELHYALGTALNAVGLPREAAACLSLAISLDPAHAPSWLNLGNACADLDDGVMAEQCCRRAISLDATLPEAWSSLGFLLTAQGRLAEAIRACEVAVALRPGFVHAYWNLAAAMLLSGDLPRGFREYEWRKRHDAFRRDFVDLPGPIWDGGDPAGRTILVQAEQGFGDTIQFARFLTSIAARGGKPVLVCDDRLAPLLAQMPGLVVVAKGAPLPRYDAWIDQMSLPLAFSCELDSIPRPEGYLQADPARMRDWRRRLPAGRKIGLACFGNPLHSNDRRRSMPAALLSPLLQGGNAGGNATFVGLHPDRAMAGVLDVAAGLTDYAASAALIANLDLVVTVDTSVAHLAGALGVPVWIMLPFAPDWRWLLERDDSPWYRSARLFRQSAPNDWAGVVERVGIALRHRFEMDLENRRTA